MKINIKITEYKGKLYKQKYSGKTGKYIVFIKKNRFFTSYWETIKECVMSGFDGAIFDSKVFNSIEEIYEYFYSEYPEIKKEYFQFIIHPGDKIIVPVYPLPSIGK
jgi:hypothetical protein